MQCYSPPMRRIFLSLSVLTLVACTATPSNEVPLSGLKSQINCEDLPVPASATTIVHVDWEEFSFDIPFNPEWKGFSGQPVMLSEKDNGGTRFGPRRYVYNPEAMFPEPVDTDCAAERDFYLGIDTGTRAELLAREKEKYPDMADRIVVKHIGSVDAIVVPAPDGVCPTPVIIMLGKNNVNWDLMMSCEGLRHVADPMAELVKIAKTMRIK